MDVPVGRVFCVVRRLLGGFLIYFGLNTLLKAPFSEAFLTSATMGAFLVRAARYCVVVFVMLGIYPMIFDRIEFGEREQPKWG